MQRKRLATLLFLVIAITTLIAAPALAQELPSLETTPPQEGGYCAPWHRCVAYGAIGLATVTTLLFGVGYLIQSRGFDKLEHRQGHPEGVPAEKK